MTTASSLPSNRFTIPGRPVWTALLGLATAAQLFAAPAPTKVTLIDYLGVDWKDDLVHYTLDFPKGDFKGKASAEVKADDGNAIPCQVSDIALHDDGSLRSFNVWFIADLPANQSATYTITPGKRGPDDGGVSVKTTDTSAELATKAPQKIGIRVLNGTKEYATPVPAKDVPGPIAGLLLPSGHETGKGRFETPFLVKSYKAEVTASGPVFAEARIRYTFDTGYWTFTARVIRGCPMVIVNEELDTGDGGQSWDTADRFFVLPLNAEGFKPTQAWTVGRTEPGFHDLMNQYVQPVLTNGLERNGGGAMVNGYTLTFQTNRTDYYLNAWPTWSARASVAIRLVEPGKDAVAVASIKTTDWRNPLAVRFRTTAKGELSMALPLQVYRQGWASEGFGAGSPNYTGRTLGVPPTTARRNYGIMLTPAADEQKGHLDDLMRQTAKLGAQPLDEVKDWILDWPDPMAGAAWAAESSTTGKTALAVMRTWVAAKRALGNYANYSMWTYYSFERVRYDKLVAALDQPNALSAPDRRALRRLCAFQAYVLNSLDEFPWGSGPHIGNPNMHMMAMAARAHSAFLVKDHPRFKSWGQWTLNHTRDFIARYTRDSGAPYENPHYTLGVTISDITKMNQTLMDTGIGDAIDMPLFKKTMRVILDWSAPADPRFGGHRMVLATGNGYPYEAFPMPVMQYLVDYYKTRDPKLASQLQWVANRSVVDAKQLHLVQDEAPPLDSIHYGDYGVFFRHGFNTPYETMFFLMAGNCDGHYEGETEQMAYTLYAKGQPIHMHFGNAYMPMFVRPWLRNRVSFDHMIEETERNPTRIEATAFTPEAEYVRAEREVDSLRPLKTEYPVTTNRGGSAWAPAESTSWPALPQWQRIPMTLWHRQVLFLKDADPRGPNYFVLRDSFGGAPSRPTDLSLWFLANSMTRQGDVFHFDGQCQADMDVFVASPAGAEPETGKYGHSMISVGIACDTNWFPGGIVAENQLFLRLKQPPDKGYLVVLYPRLKENDPAASFATLAEGVVRIETPLSTDYAFLNPTAFEFKDDRVQFNGMSGTVRFFKSGKIAVTGTEGKTEIRVAGRRIEGNGPFTVTIVDGKVATQTHAAGARVEAQ